MSKPIILVFGATGKTGGGMVQALLADGSFHTRAVTRNPESESAKALANKGVEVVKADLNEPSTLTKAMEGVYGVLGVTDFWQAFMAEEKQGKDMVDAAKAAGVKHFVWTTLDHSEKWAVPHFETKARVNDYLLASGLPRTSLYLGFFSENFRGLPFKRNESGKVVLDAPFLTDGHLPAMAASDIGRWALVAFKDPEHWIGKDMMLCQQWITPRQVAKLVSEEIGEPVEVKEVDETAWKAMRNEKFEELWLNISMFNEAPESFRDADVANKLLNPPPKSVKDLIHSWGKSLVK